MTAGARLAEELEVLRVRRRAVQASFASSGGPGDRADEAVALELADELARLDDRIGEIIRELHRPTADSLLPRGTRVRLRYPDGAEEELYVGDAGDAESDGSRMVLTADSPLGLALAGRRAGGRITYPTPDGTQVADVVAVWTVTDDAGPGKPTLAARVEA